MTRICWAVLMAVTLSASVGAQRVVAPSPVREVFPGSRVRVFAPSLRSDRYIGKIDSLSATQMVLDTTGARRRLGFDTGPVLVEEFRHVRLQLSSIERIEVTGGRTTTRSTIKGLLIGALGGGLLWGMGNLPEVNPSAKDFLKEMPVGMIVGGVIGGGVGYALGGERWLPARLP